MPNHIHGIIQIKKPNPESPADTGKYNRLENNAGVGDDTGVGAGDDGHDNISMHIRTTSPGKPGTPPGQNVRN